MNYIDYGNIEKILDAATKINETLVDVAPYLPVGQSTINMLETIIAPYNEIIGSSVEVYGGFGKVIDALGAAGKIVDIFAERDVPMLEPRKKSKSDKKTSTTSSKVAQSSSMHNSSIATTSTWISTPSLSLSLASATTSASALAKTGPISPNNATTTAKAFALASNSSATTSTSALANTSSVSLQSATTTAAASALVSNSSTATASSPTSTSTFIPHDIPQDTLAQWVQHHWLNRTTGGKNYTVSILKSALKAQLQSSNMTATNLMSSVPNALQSMGMTNITYPPTEDAHRQAIAHQIATGNATAYNSGNMTVKIVMNANAPADPCLGLPKLPCFGNELGDPYCLYDCGSRWYNKMNIPASNW